MFNFQTDSTRKFAPRVIFAGLESSIQIKTEGFFVRQMFLLVHWIRTEKTIKPMLFILAWCCSSFAFGWRIWHFGTSKVDWGRISPTSLQELFELVRILKSFGKPLAFRDKTIRKISRADFVSPLFHATFFTCCVFVAVSAFGDCLVRFGGRLLGLC